MPFVSGGRSKTKVHCSEWSALYSLYTYTRYMVNMVMTMLSHVQHMMAFQRLYGCIFQSVVGGRKPRTYCMPTKSSAIIVNMCLFICSVLNVEEEDISHIN